MEQGAVDTTSRPARRTGQIAALALLVAGVALATGYLVIARPWSGLSTPRVDQTSPQVAASPQPAPAVVIEETAIVAPQGALIVDDDAAQSAAGPDLSAAADDASPLAVLASSSPSPGLGTSRGSSSTARAASGASSRNATPNRGAAGSKAGQAQDSQLLPALIDIIHAKNAPPPKQAKSKDRQYESMDALIAAIEKENAEVEGRTRGSLASLGGVTQEDAARARSQAQSVQEALKACPRANLPAGIECRKRVCAQLPANTYACQTR